MIKATRFFFFYVDTSNCKAMISMIKATRLFFFDVDTSNCKAMITMIKATRFFPALSVVAK